MIALTLYTSAYDTTPLKRVEFETWEAFTAAFPALLEYERSDKSALPYWSPAVLREGTTRADANVEALSLLVSDLDACNVEGVRRTLERDYIAALVYESPSSTPEAPRVRIVCPVLRPILPHECAHTRLAFAESIGLEPGCGADGVPPSSIGFYAGRIAGTPPRKLWHTEGNAADVDALVARPLAHAWGKRASSVAKAPPVAHDGQRVEPRHTHRVNDMAGLMRPRWLAGDRELDNFEKAFYGWLLGAGWSHGEVVALVDALDTDEPDHAKRREHARKARAAAPLTGPSEAVRAWFGDAWLDVDAHVGREEREWLAAARATLGGAVAPAAADESAAPLLLQARNDAAHVLIYEGPERGHQPVATGALRLRMHELGRAPLLADGKRPLAPSAIVERYGATFSSVVYDFAATVSSYDARAHSVVVGYPRARVAAKFDGAVDSWLRALGGKRYERLEVWIASCDQRHIGLPAAALVLLGPPNVGKTLFACALAHLWGATQPPEARLLVSKFNGDLTRCPIVLDDEAELFGSRAMSTKRFRQTTQSLGRNVERKGREVFELRGAMRLVVAANEVSDLRFSDVTGADVVQAVSDRLCVIDVSARAAAATGALGALRLRDSYQCDVARIASHFAWLAETVALPLERFAGATGGADVVLVGHAAGAPEIWDTLRLWIDTGAGQTWQAHAGVLCCEPRLLTSPTVELAAVHEALAPFRTGVVRPRVAGTSGTTRPRLWALDADSVASALGLEADENEALRGRLAAT